MLLLRPGVEIDAFNKMGQTPLHVCACYGSLAVAKVLLRCKVRKVWDRQADRRTSVLACAATAWCVCVCVCVRARARVCVLLCCAHVGRPMNRVN